MMRNSTQQTTFIHLLTTAIPEVLLKTLLPTVHVNNALFINMSWYSWHNGYFNLISFPQMLFLQ